MTEFVDSRRRRSIAAARKLSAATRSAVETLENRLLLTVTTDANGWTHVTPTPNVSQLIYVSSSTGSDANSGLSPDAPVASIAVAYAKLRNNEPDWILFKRGDTFTGSFSFFGDSGISSQEPIVITNYGDPSLPRPVIDSGAVTAFRTGSYNHDIYILGVSFTTSTHNPTSPNFNGQGSYGLYDTGNTTDMLVEDCSFSYFVNDITFTDVSGPMYRITVRRNEILNAYSTVGHSQGLYADTVTNLTITDNVFDHDGWNADVPGGGASIFNHDCYLHSSNVNCVVTGNTFADAGSFGLQARAGGVVDNNLFINDPYGFAFGLVNGATTTAGGVTGEAIGNVVIEPRVDNVNGWGIGAMIGNLKPGGNTVISNNIFSGEPTGTQPAVIFEPGTGVSNPQDEVGINSVTFSNNTVYGWGFGLQISNAYVPGTTGSNGLNGVVIRNNNFQANVTGRIINHGDLYDPRYEDWSGNTYSSSTAAQSSWFTLAGTTTSFASWLANIEPTAVAATVPFNSPNRTIESYMASQGLAATEAAFVSGAIAQNQQNWNPLYFATTVNGYIQAGYVVVSNPPTAVATPPADVTADNYLANPAPTFTITFSDAVGINVSTITSASVSIAGPGGFTLPVTLLNTTASGNSVTATYQVTGSGAAGDWTAVPYGTYIISTVAGGVKDTSGLSVLATPLAGFTVSVNADPNPTTAAPTTPAGLSVIAGSSSINVSWSDPAGDQRSFVLQRALDARFTQGVQTFPLTPDTTSFVDQSAAVGTTYYYEVIAVNPLGQSTPTAALNGTILPPAPALSRIFLNDGNAARVAVTSATLLFTQPVSVNAASLSLTLNSTSAAIPFVVNNPSGDGKTWIVSWATAAFNNRLPDGTYTLTVHGGSIADAFGQTAGGDQTTTFTSADGPVVTNTIRNTTTPPHSISMTFSQDVSASLSITSLVLGNSQSQAVPAASYSWNPATLTATWTYSGALPDGNYSAQLSATGVKNADGVHLDGNKDGIPGDTYTYNFTVVKPTLSISGATNVNVGTTYTLTLGAITDAGQSNPSYLVHWGDGTTSPASAAGKITHSYSSASGPTTISVDVIDANGNHANCASLSVSVNRATIALAGNTNANPGATYSLTLGTVTDPGFTVSSYIVHWGDGTTNTYATNAVPVTHVYTNSGSSGIARQITVDLVDNSGGGGASFTNLAAATKSITANAYPFVPTTGVLNANVGGSYTLFIGTASDPGFTVSGLSINWGDGSAAQNVPVGSTQVSHVFLPGAPTTDAIRTTLTDNSGTYANASVFTITVNPRPTVALSGSPNANVGGNYALTVSPATDAGQAVSLYTVNWGDGTSSSAATPGLFNHTYTSAATDSITVDITDGTGFFAAAGSMQVAVHNAPTIALTGNPNANAGGVYTLNLGAVNDPGQTVTQYIVNWGDNKSDTYTAGGAVTHTYNTPGSDVISVALTDTTGNTYAAAGTLSLSVTRPIVTLSGNPGVFPTQTYNLMLSPSDQGGTPTQYVVNWGDGSNTTYAASGNNPVAASHVYSASQHTVITTDLYDETGTFVGVGSLSLYVAPPPTLSLSGTSSVGLGAPYTLTLGQATDPIGTVSSYIVHWGDNTTSTVGAAGPVQHTYSTAGLQAIVVDVVDQNGTYFGAASTSVLVGASPTIALSGNPTANAGGLYSLTLGAVNDPNGSPTSYVINWGDGAHDIVQNTGVFAHPYSAAGPANITVDLTDSVGTWTAAGTLQITVNPAPTIAVSGNANANATGVYTLTLGAVSDPGYTVSQYTVNWGDTHTDIYTTNGPVTHTYLTAGAAPISVALSDATGTFANAGSLAVTVNPTPTIALGGNSTATVGTPYQLTLGKVTDPGYAVSQYTVHWGDGLTDTYSAGGVVQHTFANAISANIQVDLTDPTGTYATAGQLPITVSAGHVAPTIILSGNANANATGVYTLTLGAVTDVGSTVTKYAVHWGDGSTTNYTKNGPVTHTYAKAGSDSITVDLTDSTGTYAAVASLAVTVNAKPTVTLSGNAYANATGVYALTLAAANDPGYTPTKYLVHWGDGTTSTYTSLGAATHTYAKAAAQTITVDLTDSTGTYTTAGSMKITVHAKPTIALTGAAKATIGSPYSLTLGAVTDTGYTVSLYTVNWGDGTSNTYTTTGVATHTFTTAAARTIAVSLTDPTGTYASAGTLKVTVAAPVNLFTTSVDIGKPPLAGSATFSNGVYTVKGSGADIYNTTDQFHYDYKNVSGNATIIAQVTGVSNTNAWAKAGVMFRNGTGAGAAFADVVCTPGGYLSFQWRTSAGVMAADAVIGSQAVPKWVKLERSGNNFSAFYSSDGTNWTQVGPTVAITMNASAAVGLAVTSLSLTALNTATFANVSVTTP